MKGMFGVRSAISKRKELLELANAMLAGEVNLIEGVRKICSLRFAIGDSENEVFFPMRAIDSETDHYPLGEMRTKCNIDYLKQMDAEMACYLSNASQDILDACKNIIRTYRC